MRIVLTRPRGRGEAWKQRLESQGHEVALVPLTEIRDGEPFPDPAAYDGVLFTSVAAVERASEGARWPRVGAVGAVTAAALDERGIGVDVIGNGGGKELAQAWARELGNAMGHRLLLPQARRAHAALEVALRGMGAEVDCVAVYETLWSARMWSPSSRRPPCACTGSYRWSRRRATGASETRRALRWRKRDSRIARFRSWMA